VHARAQRLEPLPLGKKAGLLLMAILTVLACGKSDKPDSVAAVVVDTAHIIPAALDDACIRQGWRTVCRIPEHTDDQRLNDGADAYGPKVFAAPAESLATHRFDDSFATVGEAVALIHVEPQGPGVPLPATYTNLHLEAGVNCVYLRPSSPSTWVGYVVLANVQPNQKPCIDNNPNLANQLRVTAIRHKEFRSDADVPAVIRFQEGVAGSTGAPQPLIGVKCGGSWCMLHPSGTSPRPIAHGTYKDNVREWAVRGWGDSQHLGEFVNGSTVLTYGKNLEASVVPAQGATIEELARFEGKMFHAATVYFRGDPKGTKYETAWGFAQGENEIWLGKTGEIWHAEVRRSTGCGSPPCVHVVKAVRKPHLRLPPATARFQWDPLDEGIWVRCADGCCQVSGT
jgi:hypothetical protein